MRITNNMITNGMLLNLNRNSRTTNTYYTQLATTKRFQNPSEDPISASRALRFRTNVSNTEQYQKNVTSATAWMDVSDGALTNTTEMLKDRITYLLNQGSNDTLVLSDRQKIAEEIEDLLAQIATNEMNANYAGRYVFSGYKTDEPPILTDNVTDSYNINQTFNYGDIWSKKSFQKATADDESLVNDVNVINLAYKNVTNLTSGSITFTDKNTGLPVTLTPAPTVTTVSTVFGDADYNADAYNVPAGEIRYIENTGELVFGDDALASLMQYDMSVNYDKTGFTAGEPNPKIYFDCTNTTTGIKYDLTEDPMLYGVGIGTDVQVNSLARNVFTDNMYAVLNSFTTTIKSMSLSTEAALKAKFEAFGYTGDELNKKIEEQQKLELSNVKTVGHDAFNSMIGLLDGFVSTVSTEHTSLGTRMNRLDLIEARLGDDEVNYTKLLSDNEDTDYMEAIMRLNSAETTYQAAMQVGAKIMQMSLVNYM